MAVTQDLRVAARALARTPGFALTSILVLSTGIAVSTAAFTVVNTAVKRPLPFPNPERLAVISERNLEKGFNARVSYPAFAEWRDRSGAFQEVGALEPRSFNLSRGSEPESVAGALATAGFFRALSWKTILGRPFEPVEERAGAARVVLLSQRCWERRFGADPNILGREIAVDGEDATVIGVLARIVGRSYYASYEIWAPLVDTPARGNRNARTLQVVGLLKPGAGIARAQAELATLARAAAGRDPAEAGWGVQIVPMAQLMAHTVPMYAVLLAIVLLLLLVVCANIATLQLARAAGRQPEIALRIALGASRFRVVSHLLAEGLLLAAAAGALGFLLTAGLRQVLVASLPELANLQIDATVLGFTALVSIAAGLLFGLSPALGVSRPDLNAMLKSGGRTLPAASGGRLRSLFVAGEMAVAVTLLTGLGLLVRTFIALHHADVGFRTENLSAINVSLPRKYAGPHQAAAFFRLAGERLQGLAGIESAGAVSEMPLAGGSGAVKVSLEDRANIETLHGQYTAATPEYFRTMGIRLRNGRPFGPADTGTSPGVVIVNERAAQVLWSGVDPIGRRVRLNGGDWRTVIAIAANVRQDLLRSAAPQFYVPHAQDSLSSMWMVARTGADARQFLRALRTELRALEPELRISAPVTIDEVISGYFPGSLVAGLGVFCAAALFIAALGLYGVVSYLVLQRTHEFGVRIALGAGPREVRRLVLGQGLKLAGAGAAIGLAGGFGVSRLLAGLLVGVEVSHPLVFVAVAAVLAAVELAACYAPARRAMRISPLEALRYQ